MPGEIKEGDVTLKTKKGQNMYIPPFTVSAEAINLIAEISGQIERYAIRLEQKDGLRLRKANRIKIIYSSDHVCSTMSLSLSTRSQMATGVQGDCGNR